MKVPVYSLNPRVQAPSSHYGFKPFSQQERTQVRLVESDGRYQSRQSLLSWGMRNNFNKFIIGQWLATYLKTLSVERVLSLGCGECYHEFAIKLSEPEIKITTTDFEPFVMEKVSAFLPEIDDVEVFDIKQDDFTRFQGKYDAILLLHVEASFSDDEIVSFFKKIPGTGARHMLMFSGAYIPPFQVLKYWFSWLKWSLLRWKTRPPLGRQHGWARSRGEFLKLMEAAGTLKLSKLITERPHSKSYPLFHIEIKEGRNG